MIHVRVGSPVKGENFYDRDTERSQLWQALRGDDVLLLAPRRVGKTSLMFRLAEEAPPHGFEATYLSVAGAKDEPEFVRRLYEAVSKLGAGPSLLDRLKQGTVGRTLQRIERLDFFQGGFELGPGDPWQELGAALAKALDDQQDKSLILVDEVPVFVLSLLREDGSGDRARRFLSWFRELRQQPDQQGRLRWLLAGSIGLDTVTSRLHFGDTINDLYLFRLGPFDRTTARSFFLALSDTYEFPLRDAVLEHTLDRIGWLIPYYLQLVFNELRLAHTDRSEPTDRARVDAVFDDLLSPAKKNYFDYWRQRLWEELGEIDAQRALTLLNTVAADPEGASRSVLEQALIEHVQDTENKDRQLRYLLDVLESDGYLVENDGRYQFRSPLLREFWRKRVSP